MIMTKIRNDVKVVKGDAFRLTSKEFDEKYYTIINKYSTIIKTLKEQIELLGNKGNENGEEDAIQAIEKAIEEIS